MKITEFLLLNYQMEKLCLPPLHSLRRANPRQSDLLNFFFFRSALPPAHNNKSDGNDIAHYLALYKFQLIKNNTKNFPPKSANRIGNLIPVSAGRGNKSSTEREEKKSAMIFSAVLLVAT